MKVKLAISPVTWVIAAIAIIIGLYSYWFYTHFDKVIKEVDLGAISAAKSNPFYAAERLLERTGRKAQSQKTFSILDGELLKQDTLIIESTRVGLTAYKREKIKDWLKTGGHIILLATELYDDELGTSRDIFLDELGVRLYENHNYNWDYEDENLTKVTFEGATESTSIRFDLNYNLQDASGEATFIGGNDYSDMFAQYKHGDGMITVVTDMDIWKNYSIDELDHAMFLYQLVGTAENIWFLYNTVQPSLWSTMKELIPLVIISFIILILVMLFSASWRKGAPRGDDERVQREIMQHIEAAGEFSFRNDSGRALLATLLESLENRLRRSIHQYSQFSEEKRAEKLSHLVGIDKTELLTLWEQTESNQEAFLNQVVLIQKIKRSL